MCIRDRCILPSLYAWFNIKASWDPYGNTGNISVAVINEDSGAEIMNKKVNICLLYTSKH